MPISKNTGQKSSNPRACVWDALLEWEDTTHYAGEILNRMAEEHVLKPMDRALAKELLFGTLRQRDAEEE